MHYYFDLSGMIVPVRVGWPVARSVCRHAMCSPQTALSVSACWRSPGQTK